MPYVWSLFADALTLTHLISGGICYTDIEPKTVSQISILALPYSFIKYSKNRVVSFVTFLKEKAVSQKLKWKQKFSETVFKFSIFASSLPIFHIN